MGIRPWHVPLLVMAGIIILEYLLARVLRRWPPSTWIRSAIIVLLILLGGLTLVAGVLAVGPSLAEQLATVAAAVAAFVALWLTYLQVKLLREELANRAPADQESPASTSGSPSTAAGAGSVLHSSPGDEGTGQ